VSMSTLLTPIPANQIDDIFSLVVGVNLRFSTSIIMEVCGCADELRVVGNSVDGIFVQKLEESEENAQR